MAAIKSYAYLCLGYIQMIKISDVIDMAIIAYIIYHLLLLCRKSRSGQVMKGIILLLLGLAASSFFNLHVLNFVLTRAVEIGLVALVVVFQPEIRRFLEQMGTRNLIKLFGTRSTTGTMEQAILQTVEAFGSMSRDRVGALVVFERDSILDDCVKSGTELDAKVTGELLKNIFWPKAPLHDGAVIIREGRVCSAGCVLPLSGNLNISRDLGTRHRAGIGVTEHSDAVVAIVSEETGAISVAVGGMLKRHLSLETLERLLRNELMPVQSDVKPASKLRRVLRREKGDSDNVE